MRFSLFAYRHPMILETVAVLVFSLFLGAVAQLSPTNATAQGGTIKNPIEANTFLELVEAIARAITAIGIPLVAIFLVWAGFLFVTARGNEEQLKRAKTTFFWALVGGAVVIGAWALAVAIVNFARGLGGGSGAPSGGTTPPPPPATPPPVGGTSPGTLPPPPPPLPVTPI